MGDQKGREGNEKDGKVAHISRLSSPVDCGDVSADNSISDTNTGVPFMLTQDGRNILTTDLDIRDRSNHGATTPPNPNSGGDNLRPYNPRSARNAEKDIPPLSEVLERITKDVQKRGLPSIEYVKDSITQYLNNMTRLLQSFSGMPGATRNRGINLLPDIHGVLGDILTREWNLPPLYAVLDDIANDLENRAGGLPPIEVRVNNILEHLLNMVTAFPPLSPPPSPEMGSVPNQPSSTDSNRAGISRSPTIIREHFIIHGRAITPGLSNSLINQPLENGDQFESIENPVKMEETAESLTKKERN
ncbi:hypothetical protein EMCG_04857 [[Emmonsia] crescens]|uniref:Uncharacterized protein n=1 Tax=[Emmonsia] crescens TaxID=73230 RepID=A0A0G2HR70_9EURO|nr:hypothetical protein EMCG_04857 [Emmonsia crescens UAMH 3008]